MNIDFAPLADLVAERVAAAMPAAAPAAPADARALAGSDLDLWRAYTAAEVGAWLGMSAKAVYAISPERLPRTYAGGAGTSVRYLGIHLLCYLTAQEPPDVAAIAADVRRRFVEQASAVPSAVRPLRPAEARGDMATGPRRRVL